MRMPRLLNRHRGSRTSARFLLRGSVITSLPFPNYQKFALGEAPLNMVGAMLAEDADEEDVIHGWQIKGGTGAGIFAINADTGDIRIAKAELIDFKQEAYWLTVIAGDGKLPSHEAEVIIKLPGDIQICHKARGQYVGKSSVPAHLAHSDAIGGGCPKR